jgi:hypothetical protein
MPSSNTDIANMALSHLGVSKVISDLATERSNEAAAMRAFYDLARREMLRARWWPFSKKIGTLALVTDFSRVIASTTIYEWVYAYRYPADCIDMRRILSGVLHGNDNRQTRTAFTLANDDQGKLIYTDMTYAQAEYTMDVTNVSAFPDDFARAFSYNLASLAAARVTAGDPFRLGPMVMGLYKMALAQASATAAREEELDVAPESEFVRSREDINGLEIDPFSAGSIVRGSQ